MPFLSSANYQLFLELYTVLYLLSWTCVIINCVNHNRIIVFLSKGKVWYSEEYYWHITTFYWLNTAKYPNFDIGIQHHVPSFTEVTFKCKSYLLWGNVKEQRGWLFLIKNTDIQTQVHPCAFMFAHTHKQQKDKPKKA